MQAQTTKRKNIFFYGFILFVFILLAELTSFLGIYIYGVAFPGRPIISTSDIFKVQTQLALKILEKPKEYENIHPVLGWKTTAGFSSKVDKINSYGLRSDHEYSDIPAKNIIRIAAYGDSFIYGSEVTNEGAWSTIAEKKYKNIEVLNYGVPGYATDQAYLRYKSEGHKLAPDVVVIGFAPINLRRAVNRYRRFMSPLEDVYFKPRFILNEAEKLELLDTPIKGKADYKKLINNPTIVLEMGQTDHWYEPAIYENPLYDLSATVRLATTLWLRIYNRYLDKNRILEGAIFYTESDAFKVQTKILERFVSDVKKDNRIPLVVVLPSESIIQEVRNGEPKVYAPVVSHLRKKNIQVVDLMDAFLSQNKQIASKTWFMRRHYSPKGNEVIADWIINRIQSDELALKANKTAG